MPSGTMASNSWIRPGRPRFADEAMAGNPGRPEKAGALRLLVVLRRRVANPRPGSGAHSRSRLPLTWWLHGLSTMALLLILVRPGFADELPVAAPPYGPPLAIAAFAGPLSVKDSSEIFLGGDWGPSTPMAGVAVRWTIASPWPDFDMSIEAIASRLGGDQDLWNLALVGVGSWTWQDSASGFAVTLSGGYGPSWTSRPPRSGRDGGTSSSAWMGSLLGELELRPDASGPVSAIVRYEHRSSAFGLFGSNGQQDDGTAFLLGARYRFGI